MKQLKLAALPVLLSLMAVLAITLAGCNPDDEEIVGSVTGVVRDSSTNAVLSGATVYTDPLTKAAVTDADGRYSIANIKVRSYEVVATKNGYFDGQVTATVVENTTITVNLALDPDNTPTPGIITGVVTRADNGNPVAGASVSTVPATSTVTTNAAGQYTITNVAAGSYQVNVTATGFTTASANVTVTAGQAAQGNFALTSNTQGSIAGVVRNSVTNLPLAGVSISTTPATTTLVTNASGQYQINSVAPGSYRVNASLTGYSAAYVDVSVTAGQQTAGDIALAPAPGSISGTIRNATTSATIAGVTVTTNPSTTTVVTDAGGQYLIANVPAGSYSVTANANGYEAATVSGVVVTSGLDTAVPMSLTPVFLEIEDNSDRGSANAVTPIMLIRGHVGPLGADSGDWFKLSIPHEENNGLLRLTVSNTNTGSGSIGHVQVYFGASSGYSLNRTSLASNTTFSFDPLSVTAGQDYYVFLESGSGEANYRINPVFTAGQYTDPIANDSQITAAPISVPGEVTAMIGYGALGAQDTEDWWAIQGPASGTINVTITNLHATSVAHGVIGDIYVNTVHRSNLTPDVVSWSSGTITVTPGSTYYVKVEAHSTLDSAPYRLTVTQ